MAVLRPSQARQAARLRLPLLFSCCLLLGAGLVASRKPSSSVAADAVERLFTKLDSNRDGQLDASEAERYAATAGLDWQAEGWSPQRAAAAGAAALDSSDAGETVSRAELQAHLRVLLQDHRVVDWVVHGLGLPQYAAAFKANSITALDFPLLVSDGGATLREDLGVASRLHQQQILRGLTRLILGLGELPSPPRQLECEAVNKTSVRLSWQAPEVAGHPLFHKYVLQRQHVHADTGSCAVGAPLSSGSSSCSREAPWELVADPDDELGAWWDAPAIRGTYRYRLAAWSAFGHSAYADSAGTCTVRAVAKQRPAPPPPLVPAEMQAVLAAIAAAGGSNLSAQRAGVGGTAVTWSWSAVSSAVVVGLTILLKASQLRVGARLAALGHLAAATLRGQRAEGGAEGEVLEQQQQQEKQGDAPSAAAGSGMHRVTSSQASLFSLGSEGTAAAEAERHLLQQQQQEVGGLLHSSSRSQLLASPEGSRLYGNAALVYAAQEPGEALDDAAAEVLALAIQRGQHCAHPGCHRRFDRLRDMRRKLESHYCGLCQHMHCLAHTRISPHGPRGGCGLESKCVCCACFAELAPAQQAAYERINRLPRPSSTSGNGVAARAGAAVGGDGSGAAGGYSNGQLAAAGLAASSSGICLATLDGPAQEPQAPLTESASAAARQRWRKAGSTLRALVRFKAAGQSAASTPR